MAERKVCVWVTRGVVCPFPPNKCRGLHPTPQTYKPNEALKKEPIRPSKPEALKKEPTLTYLYRRWGSEIEVYDHIREIEFKIIKNSLVSIEFNLGGSQRMEAEVDARVENHVVGFFRATSGLAAGEIVERGYLNWEYKRRDQTPYDLCPRIDSLNKRRVRQEYVIRVGPFRCWGDYGEWNTQVFGLRIEWKTSPYINEPRFEASYYPKPFPSNRLTPNGITEWSDRPELGKVRRSRYLGRGRLVFYGDKEYYQETRMNADRHDQMVHRLVYTNQSKIWTETCANILETWPLELVRLMIEYWHSPPSPIISSTQAISEMDLLGYRTWKGSNGTVYDADKITRVAEKYCGRDWNDGLFSFDF